MSRLSPAQVAVLMEMAAGPERHLIDHAWGMEPSWGKPFGKRAISARTVWALENQGLLRPTRYDSLYIWSLTPEGKRAAQAATDTQEATP